MGKKKISEEKLLLNDFRSELEKNGKTWTIFKVNEKKPMNEYVFWSIFKKVKKKEITTVAVNFF